LKICFLAAANSTHSHRWIRFFALRGHEVHWLSLVPPEPLPDKEIHFCLFKGTGLRQLDTALGVPFVRALIKKIKPDILHAHYAGAYGLMGALAGFHPFALTAWGSDILFAGKNRLKGYFVRYALKKADIITCDARHMTKAIMAMGVEEKRICLVRFGIDTDLFGPATEGEERNIRQRLGLGNAPVIISMRNHEPVYDLTTLIRAVPLVLREAPNVRFLIAGAGTQTRDLKALAIALAVMENIVFTGRIPNDELPGYMSMADIYVSTSLSDAGIAASTAEAMSCGLPVIVTDSGENREWIVEGKSGFIVPLSDPDALASKILVLIRDENSRRTLGKKGRQIIKSRNDYFTEMGKMEGIYRKVIGLEK
jgi:L-malate glycosyltransferase